MKLFLNQFYKKIASKKIDSIFMYLVNQDLKDLSSMLCYKASSLHVLSNQIPIHTTELWIQAWG